MPNKPVTHGWDHRPGGLDPLLPGYWHYVTNSPSPAWDSSTDYNVSDQVSYGVYNYQCMAESITVGSTVIDNVNIKPGVNPLWARFWIISAPLFQNSWNNEGSGLQNLRFRISLGQPHILDMNSGTITNYSDHQLEIQGSINGSRVVSIIFWLPPSHTPQNHLRLPATDDVGGTVPFTVKSDGSVWYGIAP